MVGRSQRHLREIYGVDSSGYRPNGNAKAGRLFVAAGDPDTLYVQMPSSWGSALSHRLQRGVFTTATSIGAPAEPWRRTACSELVNILSSPASPVLSISDLSSTGALDYAFQSSTASFIFGGSFHGGETVTTEQWYADGVEFVPSTEPTSGNMFRLERTTLIDWGGGPTMAVTFALQFNADGSVIEEGSCTSDNSAFATQYIGMEIFTPAFGERRNGATIVTTTADSDVVGDATDITYRAPATGHAVRIVSDIPSASRYQKTATDALQTQVKHYPQIASTAGALTFGTVTWSRTISFSKGAPNPFYWSGPANGNAGYTNVAGYDAATWDDTAKQLVLNRASGSIGRRVVFPITGLTPGQAYTLTGHMAVAGGSPSAGVTIGISANANGSSATALTNAVNGAYSTAVSGAAITASTMYITMNQGYTAASDNVLRLNEWKLTAA